MRGINDLKIRVEELLDRHISLKKETESLREENTRLKKDLEYFENQAGEVPDIAQKNRKLLDERQKIAEKIDSVIKKIHKVERQ